MPLYELLVISKINIDKSKIASLIKNLATQVIKKKGVVRKLDDLRTRELPYTMRSHQQAYQHGFYWAMTFDINPNELPDLKNQLDLDPRVIRHNIIKLASKFEDTVSPQ
eukprot:NODE_67_length_23829_cov_0.557059.p18 type:complete len:109 gc:universal NODE_67_length_23829_cov_0.557059:6643-6317(-)